MSSIQTHIENFDLAARPDFLLLATFFCSTIAVALTVFILGWSLVSLPTQGESVVSSETVVGP